MALRMEGTRIPAVRAQKAFSAERGERGGAVGELPARGFSVRRKRTSAQDGIPASGQWSVSRKGPKRRDELPKDWGPTLEEGERPEPSMFRPV